MNNPSEDRRAWAARRNRRSWTVAGLGCLVIFCIGCLITVAVNGGWDFFSRLLF